MLGSESSTVLSLAKSSTLLSLPGAKVPGSESSRERKFHVVFAPGNKSSRERKFQGTKVPPMELSLPGAKVRGNESSIIPLGQRRVRQVRWMAAYYDVTKVTITVTGFQQTITGFDILPF